MNYKFYNESNFKQTEIGLIPEDWQVVRLGEVADISSGGSAPQGSQYFCGNNYFIRVQHIDNENYLIKGYDLITDEAIKKYKLKLFKKGTIVFPKSGATVYLEKRAVLPFDSYMVSHLCAVNSKVPNLFQNFLFYVLIKSKFSEKKGDGYPTLNISEVKNFPIPLPPLPEQKAIAEVLSTIQEAKEKTEAVIKATRELKKSMMKHLFKYGIHRVESEEGGEWRIGSPETVKLKETEVGLIPEDWQVVRLGEVMVGDLRFTNNDLQIKKIKSLKKGKNTKLIPFIPMSFIPEESLYLAKWELKTREQIRSGIPVFEGDLLIAKITPCFENGKQGIIKNLPNGYAYATTEVIPIRTNNSILLLEYLAYYLSFTTVRHFLASKMEGTTGRKRLPKSQIENLKIPLPPLPIQQKIAEILKAIDDKIEKEEAKKKALENLFKSMLHNLMTGKIRVKINEG